MLKKNKEKQEQKNRATWLPYYARIVKDKTKYSRKTKHKKRGFEID